MIRHMRVVTVFATLLCSGATFEVIDSFSTNNLFSRTTKNNNNFQRWQNRFDSHRWRYPSFTSRNNRILSSRLFSKSDFSSHPYSVYYGTSGSTAKQNFDQNDNINDVYGYGPEDRETEPYDDSESLRLQSMQDGNRIHGRRGATVFGTKYDGGNRGPPPPLPPPYPKDNGFYKDPPGADDGRNQFMEDDRHIDDRRVMDRVDSLLHERDNLRRKLDEVVRENMHLQSNPTGNSCPPPFVPTEQDPYYQQDSPSTIPPAPPPAPIPCMEQDQSTRAAVDSVMDELKNMQQTVRAFEAQQQRFDTSSGDGNFVNNAPSLYTEAPTVERVENLDRAPENSGPEQQQHFSSPATNISYGASVGEATQPPEQTSGNCGASFVQERNNIDNNNNNWEAPRAEGGVSPNGLENPDPAAQILNGEYVVVINAEMKPKNNGVDGTRDQNQDERITGGGNTEPPQGGAPPFRGETFGSKYI